MCCHKVILVKGVGGDIMARLRGNFSVINCEECKLHSDAVKTGITQKEKVFSRC